MRLLQYVLVAVLVAGFVTQVPAATDLCLDRTIPANVYTERGDPVTALTAANFKASIGGKPIRVTSVTYNSGPRRIVIVIDVSGSMTEPGKLKWGLKFSEDLISLASSQDSPALLTFSNRIQDAIAFGQGRTALLAEIDKLQATNWDHVRGLRKTALEDALVSALALLKTPRVGDAICLVTDGGENASQSRTSSVKVLLESAGVRVYTFLPNWGFGSRVMSPEEDQAPTVLGDLAASTGGDFLLFVPGQIRHLSYPPPVPLGMSGSDREELASASRVFYRDIFSFHKIDVRLPEPLRKPRDWRLDVLDASGRRNKHLQVVYPHTLAPCTKEAGKLTGWQSP